MKSPPGEVTVAQAGLLQSDGAKENDFTEQDKRRLQPNNRKTALGRTQWAGIPIPV